MCVFGHVCLRACVRGQVEYKKKYEQTKTHYHMDMDSAEQLHHRETAGLHSQVSYYQLRPLFVFDCV